VEIDGSGKEVLRNAGDEWLVYGPCTYIPHVKVDVKDTINEIIILENSALKI
jgi:hypothetical protein